MQPANRTHNPQLHTHTDNLKTKAPNTTGSDHLYNTLELLMMGIVLPETCWASNKICNKNHLLHLVGILFPTKSIFDSLNHIRFPKEDHLPDCASRDNQVKKGDRVECPHRDSNPRSRQLSGFRCTQNTARPPLSASICTFFTYSKQINVLWYNSTLVI